MKKWWENKFNMGLKFGDMKFLTFWKIIAKRTLRGTNERKGRKYVWRRTENRMKVTKILKICLQKMTTVNFSCSALLVLIGRYPVWLLFFSACSKRSEASLSFLFPSGNKSTFKRLENAPYYNTLWYKSNEQQEVEIIGLLY